MLMRSASNPGSRGKATELDDILARLAEDGDQHVTGGPAGEADLERLEEVMGGALPESLRTLLGRLGAGLFYQGHEIFGPLRVMVHDIELVPSLGAMHARLRAEGLAEGLVPFHRFDGRLHLFDRRDPNQPERIVSIPAGPTYQDLPSFLRAVVLP